MAPVANTSELVLSLRKSLSPATRVYKKERWNTQLFQRSCTTLCRSDLANFKAPLSTFPFTQHFRLGFATGWPHLEPWYPWYLSWNYDIIVLTYDIIVLTYDIIGHDIIVLWYHTYDIITHMISYMMSWYDFIFHGYDIICVMISYPWIYDIIVLWYHRSMIS